MNRLLCGTIRLATLLGLLASGVAHAEAESPSATAREGRAVEPKGAADSGSAGALPSSPERPEDSATACAHWHETAQVERFDGRLLEARAALRACAEESCPTFVRTDCRRWLDEVQGQIPTVVFEAMGNEGPMTDVEVRLGDRIIKTQLDGKPVEVSTGISEFTFTEPSGEETVVRVSIHPGEVNHIVSADFRHSSEAPAAVASPLPESERVALVDTRPIPASVMWAGATTLVATAVGATLGIVAKAKEGEAEGSCAPDCSDAVVSEISGFALAADIAFGVALASGITTVVLFATRPTVRVPRAAAVPFASQHATWAPFLALSPQASSLGVRGRFP